MRPVSVRLPVVERYKAGQHCLQEMVHTEFRHLKRSNKEFGIQKQKVWWNGGSLGNTAGTLMTHFIQSYKSQLHCTVFCSAIQFYDLW